MLKELQRLREQVEDVLTTIDRLQRNAVETVSPQRHAWAITKDVPTGWDTVLGYLAKVHPDVLDSFDYTDASATSRDGWWLSHRAREQRISCQYTAAPPVLLAQGIERVRMYPLTLLAQRWG